MYSKALAVPPRAAPAPFPEPHHLYVPCSPPPTPPTMVIVLQRRRLPGPPDRCPRAPPSPRRFPSPRPRRALPHGHHGPGQPTLHISSSNSQPGLEASTSLYEHGARKPDKHPFCCHVLCESPPPPPPPSSQLQVPQAHGHLRGTSLLPAGA